MCIITPLQKRKPMRAFGHILFRSYKVLSIAVIIIGTIVLIVFRNGSRPTLTVLIPIIIVDLLLLCVVTLINTVRRGGKRSLTQLLYSTRFRLTLWYTIILALVLLVFSSIVYEAVNNDLNNATYTSLRSRLIQVASTYNPQTGKLSLAFDGAVSPRSVSGRETVQNKFAEDEIVLLMTPQGQVLQMSKLYGDNLIKLTWLVEATTAKTWTLQKDQYPPLWENPPLGPIGTTNMQAYEFGGLQFYNLSDGSYVFDQAALVNQQQQVV